MNELKLRVVKSATMDLLHCKQRGLGFNSSVLDTRDMALGNQGCPEEEQGDWAEAPLPAFVQSLQGQKKGSIQRTGTHRSAWRV